MTKRIPIEACERCVALPQTVETNHKHDHPRPIELAQLEEVAFHERSDEAGEMHWSTTVLRCRDCRTMYRSEWFEDEGHSFMDPTSDETKDRRLTSTESLAALDLHPWQRGDAAAAREEMLATRSSVVDGLRTMLLEGRAPNERILEHAVASVLDLALETGELDVIRTVLLRVADPMAAVEAIARLRHLGLDIGIDAGTPALRARAKEHLEEEDTGALLAGELVEVLRQPATPYRERSRKDTHDRAASTLGGLVAIRQPFHAEVLDAILARLLDDDAGVVKRAVQALESTRWIHYSKFELEIGRAIEAWSQKHPGNVHARRIARELIDEAEREAKRLKKT